MANIVLISGSPSKNSKTASITNQLQKELIERNHRTSLIDVRELPAEDLLYGNFNSKAITHTHELIRHADAVIVLSPVYKGSYTGILKAFLDLLPEKIFAGKVIAPVVTGGTIAHLLSIEYALKPIFSIMGAKEILHGVFILDTNIQRNEKGDVFLDRELEERVESLLKAIERKEPTI
ncbi:NADPH-dependent FMN reductase [Thermaerobacillus caldiproteolyticus]|uniref:FMN reductase n=1 Tax=Thermaerobacillus caldiproteolyticus TaxID=247480 RepID=A0A7W0BX77_9BACL|nr:NADPH-dependent FMN reductase [Anoxybacillus caldiproteolyticus]MBA2873728.1 FMN reductase [Anoxybacillus caldiproteolyticus]QPA30293.1 NADPH-dependent FMN reductase [Anoxybacillus caldiproteolyticus]